MAFRRSTPVNFRAMLFAAWRSFKLHTFSQFFFTKLHAPEKAADFTAKATVPKLAPSAAYAAHTANAANAADAADAADAASSAAASAAQA